MTAPFAIGTKVRLTGPGWDENAVAGQVERGTVVTITEPPIGLGSTDAGGFLIGGDYLPWYVDHTGYWAAEAVEEPFTLPRSRKDVQEALDALKADRKAEELIEDPFGTGFDLGYQAALEWILKAEPWTVAD